MIRAYRRSSGCKLINDTCFVQKHKEQEEEKKRVRMRAHLSIPVYCSPTFNLYNFLHLSMHPCCRKKPWRLPSSMRTLWSHLPRTLQRRAPKPLFVAKSFSQDSDLQTQVWLVACSAYHQHICCMFVILYCPLFVQVSLHGELASMCQSSFHPPWLQSLEFRRASLT